MNGYSLPTDQPLDGGFGAGVGAGPGVQVPLGPTNQPQLNVRSLSKDEAVMQLSGVETAFANSFRRICMADVPTIGEPEYAAWGLVEESLDVLVGME